MTDIRIAAPTNTTAWGQVIAKTRTGVVPSGQTYNSWFGFRADSMGDYWTPTATGIQYKEIPDFGFMALLPLSTLYQPPDSERATLVVVEMVATGMSSGWVGAINLLYKDGGGGKQTMSDSQLWSDDDVNTTMYVLFVVPAGASDISVCIDAEQPDMLCWQVSDDGVGMASPEAAMSHGNGLAGIRERVWARGGSLDINTRTAGAGCPGLSLSVRLPVGEPS